MAFRISGEKTDKPAQVNVQFVTVEDLQLVTRVRQIAKAHGITPSELIRQMVRHCVGEMDE